MGRNPSRDLLEDIREVDYGPKMKALTEQQRKFVSIVMMQRAPNFREAALEAGYSDKGKTGGYRLAHDKKVQEAIREEMDRRVEVGAIIGIAKLIEIASDDGHKDQFKAAESLADRAGYSKQHKLDVSHTHRDLTGDALMARIKELAAKHGLDPERLLKGEKPAPRNLAAPPEPVLDLEAEQRGAEAAE